MNNELEELLSIKRIRVSLKFGEELFVLICKGIDACKIKDENLLFTGCENLEIVDEDKVFLAETFSCKKDIVLGYSIGHYLPQEAEEEVSQEKAEEEVSQEKAEEEVSQEKAEEDALPQKAEEDALPQKAEEDALPQKAEEEKMDIGSFIYE